MSIASPNFKERKIIAELDDYSRNIDEYRNALQSEAVWLFVATLGCWSVSGSPKIQVLAFALTVVFFATKVASKLTNKKTFNRFEYDIEKLISEEFISGQTKEFYENELLALFGVRSLIYDR